MIIREYRENDFESIKNWITDERTHAMWCANRTPFPLQKQGFDELLKDISDDDLKSMLTEIVNFVNEMTRPLKVNDVVKSLMDEILTFKSTISR